MTKTSSQPILIFDFDGTIANTLSLLVNISNQLAEEFKFKTISDHEIHSLKHKTIKEVIHHLNVPITKIPLIAYKTRQRMRQHITEAPLAEGLKNILSEIHSKGHSIGILTSNSRKNVDLFLEHNNMEYFKFFKTSVSILGKTQQLKRLLREQKLNKQNVIYVGDEIRDIEAAKSTGIRIASVGWGYNHAETLAKHKPDYLFSHPKELLTLFEQSV